MVDPQCVFAHVYKIAILEPTVDVRDRATRVSHDWDLRLGPHLAEGAHMVHVAVSEEYGNGLTVCQHLFKSSWLTGGVDEKALLGGGAD
jgi:hypothetical protein